MTYERLCKYGCNIQLGEFDTNQNKYKELDGTLHTRERCESQKPQMQATNGHAISSNETSLESIKKTLQDIIVELEKLRNLK
ncbi:MAG: hypothetical protein ACR2KF_08520 [Nitrososphaeraceae archaeon]